MTRYEISINELDLFSGFYGSIWDYIYESEEEPSQLIEGKELSNVVLDLYTDNKEIDDLFYDYFEEYYIGYETKEIVSPKYYNFETDNLYIEILLKDSFRDEAFKVITENREKAEKFIEENYIIKSGFISLMPQTIFDIFNDEKSYRTDLAIIQLYLLCKDWDEGDARDVECSILENATSNGYLYK